MGAGGAQVDIALNVCPGGGGLPLGLYGTMDGCPTAVVDDIPMTRVVGAVFDGAFGGGGGGCARLPPRGVFGTSGAGGGVATTSTKERDFPEVVVDT